MIPLATPDLSGNEEAYLQECIRSGFVSSVGAFVSRFEEMVATASGAPGAVATSSGTCGLHLALHVAGVRPTDLVIAPTLTFIATANAISHCHASPWLADVHPDTWNLDPSRVGTMLAEETRREDGKLVHTATGRRVAAILPVHGLGLPADLDVLGDLARRFGLPVVADGAAALGASTKGRPLGPLADLTVFSFNGNKTVTAGGGGAIVASDPEVLARAAHLCSTARIGAEYDHDEVGFNYRMANVCAAVGVAQLERLREFVSAKRRVRTAYDDAIAGLDGVSAFPSGDGGGTCWFSGAVLDRGMDSRVFCDTLRSRGVGAKTFWKPVHLQAPYADAPRTETPVADGLWERIVTLPCSTWMSEDHLAQVAAALCDAVTSSRRGVTA